MSACCLMVLAGCNGANKDTKNETVYIYLDLGQDGLYKGSSGYNIESKGLEQKIQASYNAFKKHRALKTQELLFEREQAVTKCLLARYCFKRNKQ